MGCFSFMCQETDAPVLSSSFNGDAVHLFLLKNGEVIEHMYGNYDSYGRVFKNELRTDVEHELYKSFEWNMDWSDVCSLMFDKDESNGIAAILDIAYEDQIPTTQSESDPNQGWGEHDELMGYTGDDIGKKVEEPFHKVLKDVSKEMKVKREIQEQALNSLMKNTQSKSGKSYEEIVIMTKEALKKVLSEEDYEEMIKDLF